jgi:hypothetical protein
LPRHAKKRLELDVIVAVGTGDRSAAPKVVLDERAHNALLELLLEIHDIVGEVQMLRDALGVIDVIERAAAMLRGTPALELREAALIPELHGEPDDGSALLLEDGCYGGRIHAAGHGDGDEAGLRSGLDGKEIELDGWGHVVSAICPLHAAGRNWASATSEERVFASLRMTNIGRKFVMG